MFITSRQENKLTTLEMIKHNMNQKLLQRAYKFVSCINTHRQVQEYPYRKELTVWPNGAIGIGPKYGYLRSVIRPPSTSDYGLFEVEWIDGPAPQKTIVAGDKLAFSW